MRYDYDMKKTATFYIHTLGCPKNEVDSEIIASKLIRYGFKMVDSHKTADVILVNSCGFIRASKEETINTIFSFYREKKSSQKIVMLGCLAQRYHGEIEDIMPEVDCFIGADAYQYIDQIISKIIDGSLDSRYQGKNASVSMIYKNTDREYGVNTGSYTFVKIADGCSNRCSFCAIPFIKGAYKSRKIDDILKEICSLIDSGFYEIGLVSQDLTAYGIDLGYKNGLLTLLKEIDRLKGDFWIRLYYMYPRRVDNQILKLIADSKKIVHYVDIPLQHISDRILNSMKRGHSSAFIKNLIVNIREKIPDVVIRSAFIVGFPGELREDFTRLKKFLIEYRLENVGFFEYSDEEGTEAYGLSQKINPKTIKNRFKRIYEIQEEISYNINQEHIGKVYDVLIDGEDKEYYIGRYYGQAPEIDGLVYIKKEKRRLKGFVKVKIENADSYDLYGSSI